MPISGFIRIPGSSREFYIDQMRRREHVERIPADVTRFATDFSRLMMDVDRLMADVASAMTGQSLRPPRVNGANSQPKLKQAISRLQDHARLFVESATRCRPFHEQIPVPYMELDGNARILCANKECTVMLAGAGHSVSGKSLIDLVRQSDVQRLREHLAFCRNTDKASSIRVSITYNGERLPVELHIRRHSGGSLPGYLAAVFRQAESPYAFLGTTDSWSADERQLMVKLSRASTLTSVGQALRNYCLKSFACPAGMIFLEREARLQLVFQWHSSQVSKKHFSEAALRDGPVAHAFRTAATIFWNPATLHPEISRNLRLLVTGSRCCSAVFLPLRSPGERPAGVLAMVILHKGKLPPPVRATISRFTRIASAAIDRARAYDEALAARTAAEVASHRQVELLSVIAHELRNPMTPVLNWAVALSNRSVPPEKHSFAFDAIIRNVRAMNHLIDDLIDSARISAGKFRLDLAEMRMHEVARDALTSVQQSAESRSLNITAQISETIPPFFADPRRVRQILINLLNNSVKFTPAGGSITLTAEKRGDYVECIVSDTGRGIEPNFLPFVFDRFRQENRPSKTRPAGLGLGLAIVRELVELHGGKVTAHSRGPNQGASFVFRLPLRGPRTVQSSSAPDES